MSALPTLEELGVATMDPDSLAELARTLKFMASNVEEVRYLRLEAIHLAKQRTPNRPTIGYYRQLRQQESA